METTNKLAKVIRKIVKDEVRKEVRQVINEMVNKKPATTNDFHNGILSYNISENHSTKKSNCKSKTVGPKTKIFHIYCLVVSTFNISLLLTK